MKDNWDLSVLRATSVVRILTKNANIDPTRLTLQEEDLICLLIPEILPKHEEKQTHRNYLNPQT